MTGLPPDLRSLAVERRGHVAEVTLLGSGAGNLLGPRFWRELPLVFAAIGDDPDVRCVVLRGEGEQFTFGLDLGAMLSEWGYVLEGGARAEPRLRFHDQVRELQTAVGSLAECRTPVIAAVCGWCVGGGVDLIAAADIRVAGADARFSVRQTKIGIVPDLGGLQRLAGIIGEGHLRELAFTAADIDAARAQRIGLVNDVYADRDATLTAAHELADRIAANPPLVVQGVKDILEFDRRPRVELALRHLSTWNAAFLPSDDLDEAMRAFQEGREAEFEGR